MKTESSSSILAYIQNEALMKKCSNENSREMSTASTGTSQPGLTQASWETGLARLTIVMYLILNRNMIQQMVMTRLNW